MNQEPFYIPAVEMFISEVSKCKPNFQYTKPTWLISQHLTGWEQNAGVAFYDTVMYLLKEFVREKKDLNIAGSAKLAMATRDFGDILIRNCGGDPESYEKYLRSSFGAAMISTLIRTQVIYLDRHGREDGKRVNQNAPWLIFPSHNWDVTFNKAIRCRMDMRGISFEKPELITHVWNQKTGYSRIKGLSSKDQETFEKSLYSLNSQGSLVKSQHMLAAEAIEQVGFVVCRDTLEMLQQNKDKFIKDKLPIPAEGNHSSWKRAERELEQYKGKDPETIKRLEDNYNLQTMLWETKVRAVKHNSHIDSYALALKQAEAIVKEDKFYIHTELDFRGRFYPSTGLHFHYQQEDFIRGLFRFKDSKPLGPTGLDNLYKMAADCWNMSLTLEDLQAHYDAGIFTYDYAEVLKEQGLQTRSLDKLTKEDAINFVKNNSLVLYRTVEDRLVDHTALSEELGLDKPIVIEKPVSFFAVANEIYQYELAVNEGKADQFVSNLPVPVDGTVNGVGHQTAISRNVETAAFCGLEPTDIPQDFYVAVAIEMTKLAPEWFDERSAMSMKEIRKGISKRAGMVRQYAAGAGKIASNMYADCHKEGYTKKYNITPMDCKMLAKVAIQAINKVAPSIDKVKKLLQDVASHELGDYSYFDADGNELDPAYCKEVRARKKHLLKQQRITPLDRKETRELNKLQREIDSWERLVISGNGSNNLRWTLPTGFHVEYEKYWLERDPMSINFKGLKDQENGVKTNDTIELVYVENSEIPNKSDFSKGISPNFIHSMDSAHMVMTFMRFKEKLEAAGQTASFFGVHDSYSTHACDVDLMVECAKETFIELYNVDDFFKVIEEMILTTPREEGCKAFFRPAPEDHDITRVRESKYFFC